jgi:tetratricopeptide (TPR) repeat protein
MESTSRDSDEALSILLDPGKRREAEGIFRRLLTAVQEKHGTDSREAAATSNKLGEIITFDGRHAEAVELFWQAVRLSTAHREVSEQSAMYYRNLGLSLACLDRRDDAVLAIQGMVEMLEQALGAQDSRVTEARTILAKISTGWKPPLPNAVKPSSARGTADTAHADSTRASEFDSDYSMWEAAYLKSAPDTPQGFLFRLQKLSANPREDSAYNRLRGTTWMLGRSLQGIATDFAKIIEGKNSAFTQTYYIQEMLLAPVRKYLPEEVLKVLPNIAFGTLPVRTINGGALRAPKGGYVIVLDTGLFQILSYFFESISIEVKLQQAGLDADGYRNSSYRFICDYYRERGSIDFAFPKSSEALGVEDEPIIALRLMCAELFILCHEIAHVALGHLEDRETVVLRSRSFDEALAQHGEKPLLAYSYNEAKELMADIVGFSMFRSIWYRHPALVAVANNPNMRDFWENEALLVFSLLSLIEKNVPSHTGISSHPPVDKRLEALFYQAAREAQSQGLKFTGGKLSPGMDWIRKHAQMARNMPVLKGE